MKIQQLANLFHLNKQTIRFYRDQKLLKPEQKENRYFDYGLDEISTLFEIINLRQRGHSIQEIRGYMTDGQEALQNYLRHEAAHLAQVEEKLAQLEQIRTEIKLHILYRRSILNTQQDIRLSENASGLYYLTLDQFESFPEEISILTSVSSTYQSLVIDLEQFLDPECRIYHPQFALGVTHENYQRRKEYQACKIQRYHVIESGRTILRTILRLTELDELDAALFTPVKEFAHQHGLRFAAPVTSGILISMCEPENAYYVLFRFVVEKQV